jgi:PAS domain S-box-containing protein
MTDSIETDTKPPRRVFPYAWAVVLLLIAVVAVGAWLILQLYTQAREHAYRQLAAVSNLKTRELEHWLAEKTTYLAEPPAGFIATAFERWLHHGAALDKDREALLERLALAKSLAAEHRGVWLFDTAGKLRLAGQEHLEHEEQHYSEQVQRAIQTRKPILVDFHAEPDASGTKEVTLEVIVPLFAGWHDTLHAVGFLLYEIDPDAYLYPLIQSWPNASASAEVLLLRVDGDELVCLNELRHQKGAPLTMRQRMDRTGEIGVAAALKGDGEVYGSDYRGQKTFGVVNRIPSRGWNLLAKIDEDEVYAEARGDAVAVALAGSLLVAALTSIGWLALRHERQRRHTAVLEAEIARGHTEKQLDYLVRYANDIVLVMNENGTLLEANDAAVRAYGRSRDELLKCNARDLRHPSKLNELRGQLAVARRQGGVFFETLHCRRDATPFPVEVSLQEIEHEGRHYWQSIIRDISERKQQEQALLANLEGLRTLNRKLEEAQSQLLQSEKMASVGQLAAGVAHELNNPIGFVHSNLGTLDGYLRDLFAIIEAYEQAETQALAGADLSAVQAIKQEKDFAYLKQDTFQLMEESRDGLARVRKIVQDLKDFSRVGDTDWRWADLHQGLDSTLNIVWNELKYKCKVTKEYGQLPQVFCLASQINQVFMNMLVNAGQAIEEKGEITLRSGTEGDHVWVEISDTGKGIPQENLMRIFEPFYTTKPVGKGTGLGLSLSYSIVKKHQGRIEVHSEVGRGSTFKIILPVQPDIEVSTKTSEETA